MQMFSVTPPERSGLFITVLGVGGDPGLVGVELGDDQGVGRASGKRKGGS